MACRVSLQTLVLVPPGRDTPGAWLRLADILHISGRLYSSCMGTCVFHPTAACIINGLHRFLRDASDKPAPPFCKLLLRQSLACVSLLFQLLLASSAYRFQLVLGCFDVLFITHYAA
jgi:hypothetical protein